MKIHVNQQSKGKPENNNVSTTEWQSFDRMHPELICLTPTGELAEPGPYETDGEVVWQFLGDYYNTGALVKSWKPASQQGISLFKTFDKYEKYWCERDIQTRQVYIVTTPANEQPKEESIIVKTDNRGLFNGLRVFNRKDEILPNWEGEVKAAYCMYDDNDGYQEWNVTTTPDRDKNNGYRVRDCYLAIDENAPQPAPSLVKKYK